jgi:transcriptional regulator with XRE-family HTH domain
MTEDVDGWDLVARRLEAEIQERGVSLGEVVRGSGVAYKTLRKMLSGEPMARRDRLAALARYFGWPVDAFDRIRRGEEPDPAERLLGRSGGTSPFAAAAARYDQLLTTLGEIIERLSPDSIEKLVRFAQALDEDEAVDRYSQGIDELLDDGLSPSEAHHVMTGSARSLTVGNVGTVDGVLRAARGDSEFATAAASGADVDDLGDMDLTDRPSGASEQPEDFE